MAFLISEHVCTNMVCFLFESAYDGIPSAIDKHTLTDILRNEWGYEYFVISDSGAIANLCDIHYVCDGSILDPVAAVKAINAGNDVEMGGRPVSFEIMYKQ